MPRTNVTHVGNNLVGVKPRSVRLQRLMFFVRCYFGRSGQVVALRSSCSGVALKAHCVVRLRGGKSELQSLFGVGV